jgi:hypothetical protein
MNLELTYEETSLLLDSIYARLRQIERLVKDFDDPKLAKIYSQDEAALINLRNKLQSI